MTNVTIDRAENVIINRGGKAHLTGWVVSGAHRVGATPELMRGKGEYVPAKGCFVTTVKGDPIKVTVPLSVAEFERLTGWTPDV